MFDSGDGGSFEPKIEQLAELLDGESTAWQLIELEWTDPHSLTALRIAIAYQILFGDEGG